MPGPTDPTERASFELINRRYLRITCGMRRKPGTLIPIERSLLAAALELAAIGQPEFHGYAVARLMRDREGARRLTAHGTLYRALERLDEAGLVEGRWEDPQIAADEGRPRRRFYRITALGEQAAAGAAADSVAAGRLETGMSEP
jgi:DNA-binding PadR family transcriptional regulator